MNQFIVIKGKIRNDGMIESITDCSEECLAHLSEDGVSKEKLKEHTGTSQKYWIQMIKEKNVESIMEEFEKEIGGNTIVLAEKDYYSFIKNKKDFKFMTRISMNISDFLHMVKMIHLKL